MAEFTRPWSVIFSSKGAVKGKHTLDSGMEKKSIHSFWGGERWNQ